MQSDALKARQRALRTLIVDRIRHQGPIPMSEFLELALYHKTQGYYTSHAHPIGHRGDFTTASEISPILPQCLANTIDIIHQQHPVETVLELGAGTGRLLANLIDSLAQKKIRPHYQILEISPSRIAEQQQVLKQAMTQDQHSIEWIDTLPKHSVNGVVIANEVLDAICFERFRYTNGTIELCHVDDDFQPHFRPWHPKDNSLDYLLSTSSSWPDGYTNEIRPLTHAWITGLAEALASGAIFILDYGYGQREYYHPERINGSLRCYHQHTTNINPFIHLGQQDITCDVDFTAVAMAATDNQLTVEGYLSQANYLMNSGCHQLLRNCNPQALQQAKQVFMPNHMGDRFKIIGLSKHIPPLEHFNQYNQNHLL